MSGAKKKDFEDPVNAKIQRKFDLIFSDSCNVDNEDSSMSDNAAKKTSEEESSPKLDFEANANIELEFDGIESSSDDISATQDESAPKLSVVPDDSGLEFSIDFGDDDSEIPAVPNVSSAPSIAASTGTSNELDLMLDEMGEIETYSGNEGTQKTILYDKNQTSDELNTLSFDELSSISSADLMSTEEAKANIEFTIKDILRPNKLELSSESDSEMGDSTSDFNLDGITKEPTTGEFALDQVMLADTDKEVTSAAEDEALFEVADVTPIPVAPKIIAETPVTPVYQSGHKSFVSDEETVRIQATIRQLREEREELLNQIKTLKNDAREVGQDNLTLKAALDESKIEILILRKRHMVELEDMKYRVSLNEEKRALAEEKAHAAESKREKLEQKVRIDYNQVKQREKELENKLEMLSIDVDSQVQSRDQKILELRRKIDALEFNMENVSIKEQKSQDDKRKIEDKLNKIMKTLRHSIKNLEDDIDQVTDDGQADKQSDNRSKT